MVIYMSRTGKRDIQVPAGTEIKISGGELTVKGKNATLVRAMHPAVEITVDGSVAKVSPKNNTRLAKALWGTYAAHLRNMISGVNTPFVKKLQVEGIGYKAEMAGKQVKLIVGYSHPVFVDIPEGLTVVIEKNIITISGADKEVLGEFAATVRAVRKPEPYKGKGIRYEGEVVRMKQGKKVAA